MMSKGFLFCETGHVSMSKTVNRTARCSPAATSKSYGDAPTKGTMDHHDMVRDRNKAVPETMIREPRYVWGAG
jgi:hypothetical protein